MGFPFQDLPGSPSPHKILEEFEFPDGTTYKIKAGAVMMVYNDRLLMNALGHQEPVPMIPRTDHRHLLQDYVLKMAIKLYGGPPDIERYMPCEHRGIRFEAGVGRVEPETGKGTKQ